MTFFSSPLFLTNENTPSRDGILPLLCKGMEELEYASEESLTSVMIREAIASTAFGNIVISHSVEVEALKMCIGVAVSQKGIRWDNHTVHVVLLVALNKIDKQIFHDLYETLVDLFSKEDVMERMEECTTSAQFEHMICTSISHQEEETA